MKKETNLLFVLKIIFANDDRYKIKNNVYFSKQPISLLADEFIRMTKLFYKKCNLKAFYFLNLLNLKDLK